MCMCESKIEGREGRRGKEGIIKGCGRGRRDRESKRLRDEENKRLRDGETEEWTEIEWGGISE